MYAYQHRQHPSCSQVVFSGLQSVWVINKGWQCLDDKLQCDHPNHHRLFYDNRYTRLTNEGKSDVQLLFDELNYVEQKLENDK